MAFAESSSIHFVAPPELEKYITRENDQKTKLTSKVLLLRKPEGKLAEAAEVLATQKDALTLRYLDTMRDVSQGSGKSSIIFPVPLDIFDAFKK